MSLEDYPDGVCFRTAFIGHASALSQAYYSPLRGASILLFRQAFVRNFMHGTWHLPSVQGDDGADSYEHEHADDTATWKESGHSALHDAQHVIYLYNKTKDHLAPGFRCAVGGCIALATTHFLL